MAVSTLCYYMAPIIVTLLSPLVLKERLSFRRIVCVIVAVLGMVLISGIFESGGIKGEEAKGILLGFGAAVLYATVILLNKQLRQIDAMDRTVCQLLISAVVLVPYNLFSVSIGSLSVPPLGGILLFVVGIVHTGFAYYLYFGSMQGLNSQSIAIASYIDPVVAVLISIIILLILMAYLPLLKW